MKTNHKIVLGCLFLVILIASVSLVVSDTLIKPIEISLQLLQTKDVNTYALTVDQTKFNEKADESKLCVLWEITPSIGINYPGKQTNICYGSESCCNFIGLSSESKFWDDYLFIYYGRYGATHKNKISARIIHLNFDLDPYQPYDNTFYSDLAEVELSLTSQNQKSAAVSFSPPLQNDLLINITSPDNESIVVDSENVYLNISANKSVIITYSIDDLATNYLGTGTIFSAKLNGSLNYNVFSNNRQKLALSFTSSNTTTDYTYYFVVEDKRAPTLNITYNNSKIYTNLTIISSNQEKEFNIISDKYSYLTYKLNNNPMSNKIELGYLKSYSLKLNLSEGINQLTINLSDFNNNSISQTLQINFTTPSSCYNGVKDGAETGVDCGGSCSACIQFNVTTNKQTYDYGEEVLATVLSRPNSTVSLVLIQSSKVIWTQQLNSYSPNYPIYITTLIGNTTEPGYYTLNSTSYYKNTTENKVITFSIKSPESMLVVDISANATTIKEGETVKFTPNVIGYSGSLIYKWDLGNDKTVDGYAQYFTYSFNSNGTYIINLTVEDSKQKASDIETIIVRKELNVTIHVTNQSSVPLPNVTVEIDGKELETDSLGNASFSITQGIYELTVSKEGYETYENDTINITQKTTIPVMLTSRDYNSPSPKVTITSPQNNQNITSNEILVKYVVESIYDTNCSLYLKEQLGSWYLVEKTINVQTSIESNFLLKDIGYGKYYIRVDCISQSLTGSSREISFYTSIPSEDEIQEDSNIQDILLQIDQILQDSEKISKEEREVYALLKINETLQKTKTQLERYNRDLNNLQWRKLSEEEQKAEEQSIRDSIESTKSSIITKINVIESKEYVSYPQDKDLINITMKYFEAKKQKFTSSEQKFLARSLKELQSKLTVKTKIKSVNLEYISGQKEDITLINKEFSIDGSKDDIDLLEYIPKELAASAKEITFLFDHEVIEEDPLIGIGLGSLSQITYYIKSISAIEKAKETQSFLVIDKQKLGLSGITGFSVLTNLKPDFIKTANKRLIIEFIIICVLILVYLTHVTRDSQVIYYFTDHGSIKKIGIINQDIEDAKKELQKHNYESAESIYRKTQKEFSELPKNLRKQTYNKVIGLANQLDAFHINKLLDLAFFNLENNQQQKAKEIYDQVSGIYKKISKEYKGNVLSRCMELKSKLSK